MNDRDEQPQDDVLPPDVEGVDSADDDELVEVDPMDALLDSAVRGDVELLTEVLDSFPELVNERGTLTGHTGARTALHFAITGPFLEAVQLLLDRGASPNIRDEGDDAFPLHFAAEKGDIDVVRALIEHGADPIGDGTMHQLNVLGWATVFGPGDAEVVEYLVAHGAVHTIESAVAVGNTEVIRTLIAADPALLHKRMDATNKRRTPLHLAVVKGQSDSIAELLELGADLAAEDAAALTPLDQAALSGAVEIVEQLLEAGADIMLPAAVALERADDIERLLAENPRQLQEGGRYASLLPMVCERSSGDIVRWLLEAGAAVNTPASVEAAVDGTEGYTPLHAAAFHGNASAVDALLEAGADRSARDGRYDGTPSDWAQQAGHYELARKLADAQY